MSGNRVVVHKRNQNPSHIDQLGTTIPMAELFASATENAQVPKPKIERPHRLVPVPIGRANTVGDMPQASLASRTILAVVFDIDTTLVDTSEWRHDALVGTLGLFGFGIPHESRSLSATHSAHWILEKLSTEDGLPRTLHGLILRLDRLSYYREIESRCRPDCEKEYLLARLKREGYRLAACSNSDRRTVETILERSGLLSSFDVVITGEDARSEKPAPEIYLSACDRLGLRPTQVMVVDSTSAGIEAARRAGAQICEATGSRDVEWSHVGRQLERIEGFAAGVAPC